jgi:HNH endonuclease
MSDKPVVTRQLLLDVFDYNPDTGVFKWKQAIARKSKIGERAGSVSKHLGYRILRFANHQEYEHRMAWFYVYGRMPEGDIDHINGVKNDNRICNLREATRSKNMLNLLKPNKNNKTGLLGVHRVGNRFASRITINGKTKHLGCFGTPEEAHKRYLEWKKHLF